MKIEKLLVPKKKFEINLKFYFLLKYLLKAKLSKPQALKVLSLAIEAKGKFEQAVIELNNFLEEIKGQAKRESLTNLFDQIATITDLRLFLFSLRLYLIKDLLLEEAKLTEVKITEELAELDPLSLEYDNKSIYKPYTTRVNGALLALLFFSKLEEQNLNFMSADAIDFVAKLSSEAIGLKNVGLEPNQIFMLMFTETMNQSIISDSGSNYEDRILTVLKRLGIPENAIAKAHDKNDTSTEFDFFFDLDGRSFGMGAKRTLRERYKQFIKTSLSSKIDVMIEITLGLDLNKQKAETIVAHGTIIFVADEIYQSREYLQKIDGVYSVKNLNLKTLKSL